MAGQYLDCTQEQLQQQLAAVNAQITSMGGDPAELMEPDELALNQATRYDSVLAHEDHGAQAGPEDVRELMANLEAARGKLEAAGVEVELIYENILPGQEHDQDSPIEAVMATEQLDQVSGSMPTSTNTNAVIDSPEGEVAAEINPYSNWSKERLVEEIERVTAELTGLGQAVVLDPIIPVKKKRGRKPGQTYAKTARSGLEGKAKKVVKRRAKKVEKEKWV